MTGKYIKVMSVLLIVILFLTSCSGRNESPTESDLQSATEGQQGSQQTELPEGQTEETNDEATNDEATNEPTEEPVKEPKVIDELIMLELEGSFKYFWEETNVDENSPGYGITRDNTQQHQQNYGSIAASGYALAAYAIGAEYGFADKEEAEKRALKTLETYYNTVSHVNGFFYHFVRLSDGQRYGNCEVSGIDTALFLAGGVVAAEYFGGAVKETYQKIYDRVNWEWLRKRSNNRFYMAYDENGNGKHTGEWDVYAEQFLMYILGTGSDTYPVDGSMFYDFSRWTATYGDYTYIRSWANSLFVYQYSHGFLDLRGKTDKRGVDWFENSVNAVLAARQYCIDESDQSKTYSENSWGLSASLKKDGYEGMFGAEPNGMPNGTPVSKNDGTIPPYGAVGSIVFTPEESLAAMKHYYNDFDGKLWHEYGFVAFYNLDIDYFSTESLGIDKGISMVMLANYVDEFVWTQFMKNQNVQRGMVNCEIQ